MKQDKKTKEVSKETLILPVLDTAGKEVEKAELDSIVFSGKLSTGSVYRTVHNYLANQRSGTASTKTRGEVSGGGKKPWRQKGTGRARVGSIRSPLWRHGGTIFGPHPRDFSYSLPKKIKRLSLKSVFNDRALNKDMIIIDSLVLEHSKTKIFVEILKKLNIIKEKVLLVLNSLPDNIKLSVRNVPNVRLVDSKSVNTYDVLCCKKILITKDALHAIIERLR